MLIVTNPGSNLSAEAVARYGIHITPQQIVVDGEAFDTREGIAFSTIDAWVRTAKVHPHVVGTTAGEFATVFRQVVKRDREIVAVMTSRKIIGSHDAAQVAAKTLRDAPGFEDARIAVVDSGVTDVGAGLACILAGEARAAGLSLDAVTQLLDAYRKSVRFVFTVSTLDYLVKGGRATAVRAFLANLLGVRPVMAFEDGEIKVAAKVSAKADAVASLVDWLVGALGAGRRVWAGVFHGGIPARAAVASGELCKRFDVAFACTRPLSPSIYLHGGPGCLGVVAVPLDALPWQPPAPAQPGLD